MPPDALLLHLPAGVVSGAVASAARERFLPGSREPTAARLALKAKPCGRRSLVPRSRRP